MNNYNRGQLMFILKRISIIFGILVAIFSIYFSWDGLDQTVTGGNTEYSEIAKYIGAFFAILITLLQFIFNTDFHRLNLTLKILGALSYVYSIYTNFEGIQHIFGFPTLISWMGAGFMDILPESLIAWGLDEHLQGDFLGNAGKMVTGFFNPNGSGGSKQKQYSAATPRDTQPRITVPVQHKPHQHQQGKKGQGRSFLEEQRIRQQQQQSKPKFAGFGESKVEEEEE